MATEAGGSGVGEKRRQASWTQPLSVQGQGHGLRLLNSLTRKKELFVPRSGKTVDWYICGPTVYDSAHAGHARAYVCFDILRRVLRDYFGYAVRYVMNVTDIDDKIIARARRRHLLRQYQEQTKPTPTQLASDLAASLELFSGKVEKEENEDKLKLFTGIKTKVSQALQTLQTSLGGAEEARAAARALEEGGDVVSEWLDVSQGDSVTDQAIFAALARHFEAEFHQDMASLGVEPPDVLTRVSEYVPEIVQFIQQIIDKRFAYESNGSVYFDTAAFNGADGHFYAKLVPEGFGDASAVREGEGELFSGGSAGEEKRSANDFALWKRSKAGEPRWESPWGLGRPGWHIECSVMASAICGPNLDIHSGGSDLKFPHHDNEIAQSEAAFGHDQWANYWLHAGTLRIEGCKMSKSLKNFISIRKALEDYTPRQLRILFLLHGWADALDYSTNTLALALAFEKNCNEFFLGVKHYLRQGWNPADAASFTKFEAEELALSQAFATAQADFHTALCDNIDTKIAMTTLKDIISAANQYIKAREEAKAVPSVLLLRNIALFVTRSLRVFGAITSSDEIGFGDAGGGSGGSTASREELLMPYLNALVDFREQIRSLALEKASESKEILAACDRLRNSTLPGLGVRLEDKEATTIIKLVSAEELRREAEQRRELEERKKAEKAKKEAERMAKEAKNRIPPAELFRQEQEGGKPKYSQFDDAGVPTHNGCRRGARQGTSEETSQGSILFQALLPPKPRLGFQLHETHTKKYDELMAKDNGVSNGQQA